MSSLYHPMMFGTACCFMEFMAAYAYRFDMNPVIFGGIRLFGKSTKAVDLSLINSKAYNSGVLLLKYKLNYK